MKRKILVRGWCNEAKIGPAASKGEAPAAFGRLPTTLTPGSDASTPLESDLSPRGETDQSVGPVSEIEEIPLAEGEGAKRLTAQLWRLDGKAASFSIISDHT